MSDNVLSFDAHRPGVLEFFAGVGLARMGLERAGFRVRWANDYEPSKHEMYLQQFGEEEPFVVGDVGNVRGQDLPLNTEVAWASSPCTDLSLAGNRQGLAGRESSAFYQFTRVLREMGEEKPGVAVLENVLGLATSHGGEDLAAAVREFNELGYSVDVLALDARRWVPQSRPRLFLVGSQNPPEDCPSSSNEVRPDVLQTVFGDPSLRTHRAALPAPPMPLTVGMGSLMESIPNGDERWWDAERTAKFHMSLSPIHKQRVRELRYAPRVSYRTAYRRTRNGVPVWEVRPDDISGCLRTARGGSSKQAVVRLGHGRIQVRWMTGTEYARLMGAGTYDLSGVRDSQVHFAFGDAVAVPAVQWLADNYLMPLVRNIPFVPSHPVQEELQHVQ